MGPFSVTGQPNAMGGREVGGLANMLAAHLEIEGAPHRAVVREFWGPPAVPEKPGLKAVDLFRACGEGRIDVLWILGTNPVVSMPEADRVAEAIGRVPLVVVSDMFAATDTARRAHVLLPALGWGEKSGTVTNSERRVSRQRPFLAAPGEARPDWWALAEVGRRMGWGEAFAWDGPAAIFREHAALSTFLNAGRRPFDLGPLADLDQAAYDALAPRRWPLPSRVPGEGGRLFGHGGFPTPDGRARLVPTPFRPPAERVSVERPLPLNTGRVCDQWHAMTRTGRVPRLLAHPGEPTAAMAPADAARLGVADGGLVRLTSAHGNLTLRAAVSTDQREGEVWAAMHWTDAFGRAGGPPRRGGARPGLGPARAEGDAGPGRAGGGPLAQPLAPPSRPPGRARCPLVPRPARPRPRARARGRGRPVGGSRPRCLGAASP
jgi:assimilatory nitrate reductase catalytic subunit